MHPAHRIVPAATLAVVVAVALTACGRGADSKRLSARGERGEVSPSTPCE